MNTTSKSAPEQIQQKAKNIQLLICDIDGVFTDGSLLYNSDGEYYKAFNVRDGLGIKLLMNSGVKVAVITARVSPIIERRMRELGISDIYQGQESKVAAYEALLEKYELDDTQVAYIGDDLPDLTLIRRSGVGITVPNSSDIIQQHADWQTYCSGGHGAIREVCELIMQAQQTWQQMTECYL